jgi:prepilin-type N-terminal cleavage/methylation domain-containing protein
MYVMKNKKNSRNSGFTLIEILVAVAIVTMLGGAMVAFQQSVLKNTKFIQSSLLSQQQARKTLTTFVKEVRVAAPSASGAYAIESAGTSSLVFYANIDKDAAIERVRYFYATSSANAVLNTLRKGTIDPVGTTYPAANERFSTVVGYMKNSTSTPIFTYYDTSYAGTSSALTVPINIPLIRLIQLNLVVDPNAARSPVVQTYTTQVTIRNLKTNL